MHFACLCLFIYPCIVSYSSHSALSLSLSLSIYLSLSSLSLSLLLSRFTEALTAAHPRDRIRRPADARPIAFARGRHRADRTVRVGVGVAIVCQTLPRTEGTYMPLVLSFSFPILCPRDIPPYHVDISSRLPASPTVSLALNLSLFLAK
jgi:hypothetical protein